MSKQNRRRRSQSGLTLIEMLVVVIIIAAFSIVVGPQVLKFGVKGKITAAQTQIQSFEVALAAYKLSTGIFPSTEQGLSALVVKPANVANWDGPYLKKAVPLDQWGRPWIYKYPGDHGDEPDILSYGPDGQPGGDDDIVSWK